MSIPEQLFGERAARAGDINEFNVIYCRTGGYYLIFWNGRLLRGEWMIHQEHYSAESREMQLHYLTEDQSANVDCIFAIRSYPAGDRVFLIDRLLGIHTPSLQHIF